MALAALGGWSFVAFPCAFFWVLVKGFRVYSESDGVHIMVNAFFWVQGLSLSYHHRGSIVHKMVSLLW